MLAVLAIRTYHALALTTCDTYRTTISSFSLPLSLALTSIANLNTTLSSRDLPPTQLVLLDSLAGEMTLPILSPKGGKVGPSVDVRRMVEKVCDWTGVVQKRECS